MDGTQYLVQTAPALLFQERCDRGHIHVQMGWVSHLPPQPHENPYSVSMHPVSGEYYRPLVELTFSLN